MAGNGPVLTSPLYCSDEDMAVRARSDYWMLTSASDQLAYGTDGVISSGTPWVLTSASINFQAQGITAQNVMLLTSPRNLFQGSGRYFAVDSVTTNSVTLRTVNQALNVGQPPAIAGASGVTFLCSTFVNLIEDASWDIKSRYGIDENTNYRASSWVYTGAEDQFRDLRAATVLQALKKAYMIEARGGERASEFFRKAEDIDREYREVLDRVQVRWGPLGNSSEPATIFSCRLSR